MRFLGSHVLALFVAGASGRPFAPRGSGTIETVDLGYAVYQGVRDVNSSINVFKGYVLHLSMYGYPCLTFAFQSIRYAAPPLGNLRFAAPQPPLANRSTVQAATGDPPICPQTGASKETPGEYGFGSRPGNEDCLFLNVYAPANASGLPVFFWIRE